MGKKRFLKWLFSPLPAIAARHAPQPSRKAQNVPPAVFTVPAFSRCTSPALLCDPTIRRQCVLPSYRGTASGKNTSSGAPHHLFVLLAVLFFPPDAGSRDRNRHAPSPCPDQLQRKKFLPAGYMDRPVPPARQRQHVNHLNMCRQRRTATKDTTRPVTLWQEGNFFPGRSKALRYNARTGRRTALSPAPHAERLGDIRKKRPSCLASGSTAGGRQRIGVREESGKDAFPALAAIPRIWQARSSGQRTKGMEPFLLPARSTVRRVKKSRSGSIALKPQRRLPDKRPSSHAAKAFSVRNAWRFKPYDPVFHGKKNAVFPLGSGRTTLCRRLVFPFSKGKTLSPVTTREFFACHSKDAPAPPSASGREAAPATRELRSSATASGNKGHDLRH